MSRGGSRGRGGRRPQRGRGPGGRHRGRKGGAAPRGKADGAAAGGVLPSRLWQQGRGGGGQAARRRRGAQQAGTRPFRYTPHPDLPPPPVNAAGKPYDVEEELAAEGEDGAGEASGDDDEPARAAPAPLGGSRPPPGASGGSGRGPEGAPARGGDGQASGDGAGAGTSARSAIRRRSARRARARLKQRARDFQVSEVVELAGLGERGRYVILRVRKRKLSTVQAAARIARAAGVAPSAVAYAGLKDKQAVAIQYMSLDGPPVQLREPGLQVSPIGRRDRPITSAELRANRFRITVRGLSAEQLHGLAERLEEVRRDGIPNYFDSQRFGSVRHGQGLMARELVRGQPERALRLFMATPSARDRSRDFGIKRRIRARWGAWAELARRLRATPYGRILGHLAHAPHDFWGAVGYMPRQLRALHLFAYQSLLWNRSVILLLRALVPRRERFTVPYACGRLSLWRRLEPGLRERFGALAVPLLGPETAFDDPDVERACRRVLAAEGIDLQALALPPAAGGFFRTEPRALLVVPERLRASEPVPDELDRARYKVELRFELRRGAYGTLVVKRLWPG